MRTTCAPPFSEWKGSSCVGDSYQCSVHGVSIVHHNICPRLQHLQWGVRKIPSFCAESQRKSFHAWRTLSFLTAFDSPQAVHPGLQLQNFARISTETQKEVTIFQDDFPSATLFVEAFADLRMQSSQPKVVAANPAQRVASFIEFQQLNHHNQSLGRKSKTLTPRRPFKCVAWALHSARSTMNNFVVVRFCHPNVVPMTLNRSVPHRVSKKRPWFSFLSAQPLFNSRRCFVTLHHYYLASL